MGKTYSIRKVGGGRGVKWDSEKKKTSVGLFSTFRHPLGCNSSGRRNCFCHTSSIWTLIIRFVSHKCQNS